MNRGERGYNLAGKRILITGGLGFVGSHLARSLLEIGADITIFDNFLTGKIDNIEHFKDKVTLIRGDIKNHDEIRDATKGQDITVHEAFPYAKVSPSLEAQFIEDSYLGTFNVLKAAVYNDIEKVIYGSSVAVYGENKYLPMDEEHPKNPYYPYGVTKFACEKLCSSFSRSYGLNTVSLRYFNVYGPLYTNLSHSVVLTFLKEILANKPPLIYGDGNQVRDFTYIDDAVQGTILAMIQDTEGGDVFNIGSGQGTKIVDLANKVVSICNSSLTPAFADEDEYRHYDKTLPWGVTKIIDGKYIDTRNFIADISKASKMLGYSPKVSIEKGILRTLEWLKEVRQTK